MEGRGERGREGGGREGGRNLGGEKDRLVSRKECQ